MSKTPVVIDPPIDITQPNLQFNNMIVEFADINLGVSASFIVFLYNDTQMISTRNYIITGEDYANWGNDDQYIYTWIIAKIRSS